MAEATMGHHLKGLGVGLKKSEYVRCSGTSPDIAVCQQIHNLVVPPLEAVRIGSNARITCRYRGTGINVQYITWTKVFIGGGKAQVFGYDSCSREDAGYYDLKGRSLIDVVKPSIFRNYTKRTIYQSAKGKNGIENFKRVIPSYGKHKTILQTTGKGTIHSLQPLATGIINDMLIGSATLTIQDVRLEDEARYECLVKPVGGPAETDIQLLTVVVLPEKPVITQPDVLIENTNYSFVCSAFVGRPTGVLQWFINAADGTFKMLPDEQVQTDLAHYSNGTSSAESHLVINVTEEIHKATLKCEVSSRAMRPWEKIPSYHIELNILYPPRKGKILYDSNKRRYYCDSAGNPKPSFIWMWVLKDGTKTILSTSPYLDLSPIQSKGIFQFQCLASNMIEKQRHTIVMKTKIKIEGITTPIVTTTTGKPNTHKINSDKISEKNPHQKWNVAVFEPYKIDSKNEASNYDGSQDGTVPLWDIIHGYISSNPVSSSNYNISQISKMLVAEKHAKEMHNVQVKNSGSSYLVHDVVKPIDIKTIQINHESPITTSFPKTSTQLSVSPITNPVLSTKLQQKISTTVVPINTKSKSSLKISETELSAMSPENYEYTEENEVKDKDVPDVEPPSNEDNSVEIRKHVGDAEKTNIKSQPKAASSNEFGGGGGQDYDVVSDIIVVPDHPRLPTVTISELISGRYRKNRPQGKEITNLGKIHLVPWNTDGTVNFTRIFRQVPGHTKRLIMRKISKIKRNLTAFLKRYEGQQLKLISAKEGTDDSQYYLDIFGDQYDNNNTNPLIYEGAEIDQNLNQNLDQLQGSPNQDPGYQQILDDYKYDYVGSPMSSVDHVSYITEGPNEVSNRIQHSNNDVIGRGMPNKFGILLTDNKEMAQSIPKDLSNQINSEESIRINNQPFKFDLTRFNRNRKAQPIPYVKLPVQIIQQNVEHRNNYMKSEQLSSQWPELLTSESQITLIKEKDRLELAKDAFLSNQYKTEFPVENSDSRKPSFTPYSGYVHKKHHHQNLLKEEIIRGQQNTQQTIRKWEPPRYDAPHDAVGTDHKYIQSGDAKTLLSSIDLNSHAVFEKVSLVEDKEYDCTGKTNGAYGGGCRAFYRCVNGHTYKVECRAPNVFNKRTDYCDKAINAPSPCGDWQDCQNKPNGKYVDVDKMCKYYYTCYQGMFLGHNECNPGTVFNEDGQICDWPNNVSSPCGNI